METALFNTIAYAANYFLVSVAGAAAGAALAVSVAGLAVVSAGAGAGVGSAVGVAGAAATVSAAGFSPSPLPHDTTKRLMVRASIDNFTSFIFSVFSWLCTFILLCKKGNPRF